MKSIKIITFFLILLSFNILKAKNDDNMSFQSESIIGLSYNNAFYGNNDIGFLELRDQMCYEINEFPVVPFLEANVNIGLTDYFPNAYISLLFGLKRKVIDIDNGFNLSIDLSSGIAVGPKKELKNGITSLINRIGFGIGYKYLSISYGITILSGDFPFKGTFYTGLNYKF